MRLTAEPDLQAKTAYGPLPLVIGITGHRDLVSEDTQALRQAIANVLADFRIRYPHTPLVLLSGLAEGADRLAAEVALQSGASHIAILPRPVEAYLDDFTTPESRQQFRNLLDRSTAVMVAQSNPSNKGYSEQGAWIAISSYIVLAFWDGQEGAGASGTADVIRMCLQGFPSPLCPAVKPLDPMESRPVWWMKTRRLRHPQPQGPVSLQHLFPGAKESWGRTKKAYDKLLADTETFNRKSVQHHARIAAAEQQSLDNLLPVAVRQQLSAGISEMAARYARADVLAIRYQRLLRWCMDGMLVSIFFAAIFSQLRTWTDLKELTGETIFGIMQWAPLIFFLAASGCYLWERFSKYHTRYLDYRALAEGLRVQIFWSIAGVRTNVADEYLTRYRGEIEWIRRAIRSTLLWTRSSMPEGRSIVAKHWVGDQQQFFARSSIRQERLPRRIGQAWKIAIAFGFIIAVMKMLPPAEGYTPNRLLVIAGLAVVALGLFKLRVKILAFAEQARQYRRMADVFSRAAEKLNAGADQELIFTELGCEALAENADWLLLHRERPLELPKA